MHVKLKCGSVFREQLTVGSSGNATYGLTITSYDSGAKPIIRATDSFNSWVEVDATYNIWQGNIGSNVQYSGILIADGSKKNMIYIGGPAYSAWEDERFSGKYESNNFRLRSNDGDPGEREVGVREHCIDITNHNYVTIDGLGIYGPTGATTSKLAREVTSFIGANADYITIQNCDLKHSYGFAIRFDSGSIESTVDNNYFYDCWGGVQLRGCGDGPHTISNNEMDSTAITKGESGDREMIGIAQNTTTSLANGVIIEHNHFHDHGAGLADADGAGHGIASVEEKYITIRYNLLENGSHNFVSVGDMETDAYLRIYHNIIDTWDNAPGGCTTGDNVPCAIKTAATGTADGEDIEIYNNLFIGGGNITGSTFGTSNDEEACALYIKSSNTNYGNINIRNNIFYDNDGIYEMICTPYNYDEINVQNNCFYHTSAENMIDHNGTIFDEDGLKDPGGTSYNSHNPNAKTNIGNNLFENPDLVNPATGDYKLDTGSPCEDDGYSVGITEDYDGNTIPTGSGPDIGPYEKQ